MEVDLASCIGEVALRCVELALESVGPQLEKPHPTLEAERHEEACDRHRRKPENEESAERFQRDLARSGVERELVKAGVMPGDAVKIGKVELEWDPDEA